jgi:hypothetical protein
LKYINGTLKILFGLDTTSKPKPVAGPDDLLLLLVQHWARDESVFPTEDDRHDVATIMLFQSYTGGRPAEFVHSSKGKASQDPLGEAEDVNKREPRREAAHNNYDNDSDADDGPEYDDDSDAGDGPEYDDDCLFDCDDDRSVDDDDNAADEETDENGSRDSGYSSDGTDVTITEDTANYYTTEVNETGESVRPKCDAAELDEHGEAIRKYKALCYEDICLWIVQDPKRRERDLLAMEVHLRHHKGVDNKPKPYVALPCVPSPG